MSCRSDMKVTLTGTKKETKRNCYYCNDIQNGLLMAPLKKLLPKKKITEKSNQQQKE